LGCPKLPYAGGSEILNKEKRKYDITIDGYKIRNNADFNRVDMNKSERRRKHRKAKLEKRDEHAR